MDSSWKRLPAADDMQRVRGNPFIRKKKKVKIGRNGKPCRSQNRRRQREWRRGQSAPFPCSPRAAMLTPIRRSHFEEGPTMQVVRVARRSLAERFAEAFSGSRQLH